MKVFIDSSLLVEYIKETKIELLEKLIISDCQCCTNAIVYSEFMFYYLAVIGGKSPLSIKESKKIKETIKSHNPIELFSNFDILPIENEIIKLSYEMMSKYNLLPNDALILATVQINKIKNLASFDENDFKIPCQSEAINLINTISDLNNKMNLK
ncbi:MAG: PIN domain-containing protein [Bacteroidales bacterium]|nr:PIN domain-containing protein [Bacteroidales bacterium]